jgi:hypothetical protein
MWAKHEWQKLSLLPALEDFSGQFCRKNLAAKEKIGPPSNFPFRNKIVFVCTVGIYNISLTCLELERRRVGKQTFQKKNIYPYTNKL